MVIKIRRIFTPIGTIFVFPTREKKVIFLAKTDLAILGVLRILYSKTTYVWQPPKSASKIALSF